MEVQKAVDIRSLSSPYGYRFDRDVDASQDWSDRFGNAYTDFRICFADAHKLSGDELDSICSALSRAASRYEAASMILVGISAMLGAAAFLLSASSWAAHWQVIDKLLSRYVGYPLSPLMHAALSGLAALSLFAALPYLLRSIPRHPNSRSRIDNALAALETAAQAPATRWFTFVSLYLLALPVSFVLAWGRPASDLIFAKILGGWLALPTGVFLILGTTILGIVVFYRLVEFTAQPVIIYRSTTRLMRLVVKLRRSEGTMLTMSDREHVVEEISSVAMSFEDIFELGDGPLGEWVTSRMHNASSRLMDLSAWLYFPQDGTMDALLSKLADLANVMLSGNLHYLDEVLGSIALCDAQSVRNSKWKSVLIHAAMAAYFISPLLGLGIAARYWQFHFGGLTQSIAGLLYLLWVLIGFLAFSDSISPDSRELLANLLRLIVSRKE